MAWHLCATDFSISSGGRTDVRRHQESASHANWRRVLLSVRALRRVGWSSMSAHGQNEVDVVIKLA